MQGATSHPTELDITLFLVHVLFYILNQNVLPWLKHILFMFSIVIYKWCVTRVPKIDVELNKYKSC